MAFLKKLNVFPYFHVFRFGCERFLSSSPFSSILHVCFVSVCVCVALSLAGKKIVVGADGCYSE